MDGLTDLTPEVRQNLDDFVSATQKAFGQQLRAIVLYGSAAEGRLRATSDVNLVVVLKDFNPEQVDQVREPFRLAATAIQLGVMFLLEQELQEAVDAFAVKFSDILIRRRVLFGDDPFANMQIPCAAILSHVKQVLLNLRLRLRERYALVSLRQEQLALVVADSAGPLRSCAMSLATLMGVSAPSPREALHIISQQLPGGPWDEVLGQISQAREQRFLAPGTGCALLFRIMELSKALYDRANQQAAKG